MIRCVTKEQEPSPELMPDQNAESKSTSHHVSVSYRCITKHRKCTSLEQHTSTICQALWVRSQGTGSSALVPQATVKVSARLSSFLEFKFLFQAHVDVDRIQSLWS